ncbi:hypothetical protein QFZ75_008016 [Streptomyces sp. V3I8]|uniref:hypothetical protein n=1 Tax=Streptomyces sp. V3I8 TaxID=3042279 RepID=UPI0027865F77|nr:hypothetical protein [Streptomyces sp. V3I8]MDQ1041514.1 hypothetical protein [Streptomyces sp. V3I8]
MSDTRVKINFDEEPCGRCSGTGQHSYNQRDGRVCWGCSGRKVRLSPLGKRAADAYEKALHASAGVVKVQDLAPGMIILSRAQGGVTGNRPWDHPAEWRTVAEVTVSAHTFSGWGVHDGLRVDVDGVTAEIVFEGGKTWRAESSEDETFWHKSAMRTIYTERHFHIRSEEARAARDEVRRAIAKRFKGAWLDGEEPPVKTPRLRKSADMPKAEEAARPLPSNRFGGKCRSCGAWVEAEAGHRLKIEGAWKVEHKPGECAQEAPAAPAEAPAADGTPHVLITRARLYPEVARPGPAWVWSYNYHVDGGPVCQYGPGLDSLRSRLRQKFGSDVRITEEWKRQERPAPAAPATDEGIYRHGGADGTLYRVRRGPSGYLYAHTITWDAERQKVTFAKAPGMARRLSAAERLGLAEVERISALWDSCALCGAEMTVSKGIGPICRKRV